MLNNENSKRVSGHPGRAVTPPWAIQSWRFRVPAMICGLLLLVPMLAACNPQSMAQATEATVTAQAGSAATPTAAAANPTPGTGATTTTTTPGATPAASGTAAPGGTDTPRPTPAGPTPADPASVLNVFQFFPSQDTLVKRDPLLLPGSKTDEMVLTVTGPGETITSETNSALAVVNYDPKYREWNLTWQSNPVIGTASPLPAANRAYGYNGGDILHTGAPVLALRTTTRDRHAHLYIYKWDASKHQASLLKMVPTAGGAERDAAFEADLDLNMVDLNGDGVYEVVADNLTGVQTWKWDGSKFVPEGNR